MIRWHKTVAVALLLLAVLGALSRPAGAELTLRQLVEKDIVERKLAADGVSPTSASTAGEQSPTTAGPAVGIATTVGPAVAIGTTAGPAVAIGTTANTGNVYVPSTGAAAAVHETTSSGGSGSGGGTTAAPPAAATPSPEAHPAAPQPAAPQKQVQSVGLGTSAAVGIGVGVGVACLVAVGSVIGVLVHLRRRKRKVSQLEKQKTYGGTE